MKMDTNELKYQARYNMKMCMTCLDNESHSMARYYYGKATAYEEVLQDLGVDIVSSDYQYSKWCERYDDEVN